MSIKEVRQKLKADWVGMDYEPICFFLKRLKIDFDPDHVKSCLEELYEDSKRRNQLQGKKRKIIQAGFVYSYCFLINQRRTQKQIQKATGVSMVSIRKVYELIPLPKIINKR